LGLLKNKDEIGWAMLNAWLGIILCGGLIVGNPCLKDQLEDLKHVGKIMFWEI
jgi:hypothetical protein